MASISTKPIAQLDCATQTRIALALNPVLGPRIVMAPRPRSSPLPTPFHTGLTNLLTNKMCVRPLRFTDWIDCGAGRILAALTPIEYWRLSSVGQLCAGTLEITGFPSRLISEGVAVWLPMGFLSTSLQDLTFTRSTFLLSDFLLTCARQSGIDTFLDSRISCGMALRHLSGQMARTLDYGADMHASRR